MGSGCSGCTTRERSVRRDPGLGRATRPLQEPYDDCKRGSILGLNLLPRKAMVGSLKLENWGFSIENPAGMGKTMHHVCRRSGGLRNARPVTRLPGGTLSHAYRMAVRCAVVLVLVLQPETTWAEGAAEIGSNQGLDWMNTLLFVDILDPLEEVRWVGVGSVTLTLPSGDLTLGSGDWLLAGEIGRAHITLSESQPIGTAWDVAVRKGGLIQEGRLFAYIWSLDGGDLGETSAINASFFARLTHGDFDEVAIVRMDGLAGWMTNFWATRIGASPDHVHPMSVPALTSTPAYPEYRLYLNHPPTFGASSPAPLLTSFHASAEPDGCPAFVHGETTSFVFRYDGNVDGEFYIVCDLNQDQVYDITDLEDLVLAGSTLPGTQIVAWYGLDNDDNPVPPGSYLCQGILVTGAFHIVFNDLETSFEGLRMFRASDYSGLRMYWNDSLIQANVTTMPNGDTSPESSGPEGVSSGSFAVAAEPHGESIPGNARAWGNFTGAGKGNEAYVDTLAWLYEDRKLLALEVAASPISNHFPVALEDRYEYQTGLLSQSAENGVLNNDLDCDGDPLSAALVTPPAHDLSFQLFGDGSFFYEAGPTFPGEDHFTYQASDSFLDSLEVTVVLSARLFSDGFESRDTTRWSATAP